LLGIADHPAPGHPAIARDPVPIRFTLDPCREGVSVTARPREESGLTQILYRFADLGNVGSRPLPPLPFLNCRVPLDFRGPGTDRERFTAKRSYEFPIIQSDRVSLWQQSCSSLHGQADNWCAYRFDLRGKRSSCLHGSCQCRVGKRDPAFSPSTDTDLPGYSESESLRNTEKKR
jgi:hypothetical protein